MGSVDEYDGATHQARQEVVFVLRVRPGLTGWRGQVQRLVDGRSARSVYVTSTQEIYLLLEGEWQLRTGNAGSPGSDGRAASEPQDGRC